MRQVLAIFLNCSFLLYITSLCHFYKSLVEMILHEINVKYYKGREIEACTSTFLQFRNKDLEIAIFRQDNSEVALNC